MRVLRFLPFVFASLLSIVPLPLPAQQAPSATKDPQAVSILKQALGAAGGTTAILALADYKATGTVTYHENQDLTGSVTLRGLGFTEFREDASLPSGIRSFSIHNGLATTKSEAGGIRHHTFRYQLPLMESSILVPCWQLAAAVGDPLFGLSYKGTTTVDGYTVHDIRIQLMPPGPPDANGVIAEYFGADFFVDTTTFQVRMTQDVVIDHFPRKVRFSNYKTVNGVLVPFSIDEEVNGQRTQTIQLEQSGFNTGLQGSDFEL
jgi:hypothetical protein